MLKKLLIIFLVTATIVVSGVDSIGLKAAVVENPKSDFDNAPIAVNAEDKSVKEVLPTNSDRVVVKLKEEKNKQEIKELLGDKVQNQIEKSSLENVITNGDQKDLIALDVKNEVDIKKVVEDLKKNPEIETASISSPLQLTYTPSSNPNFVTQQQYLKDATSGIYAESAWGALGTKLGINCAADKRCGGEQSVKIAVIDTGVNTGISDFVGTNFVNQMRLYYATSSNGQNPCEAANDLMIAFFDNTGEFLCRHEGSQSDPNGHGTKVASVIGMQDNTIGGVGVAYNTSIMPISINDAFDTFGLAVAVRYAKDNGAKVINMSVGTPYTDSVLESEINAATAAGVVVVAASGNCGNNTGGQCFGFVISGDPLYNVFNPLVYPGAYPNVISVGASNSDLTRSSYSTYNSQVDISVPIDFGALAQATNGSFSLNAGTSFASPVVAGAVGLMMGSIVNLDFENYTTLVTGSAYETTGMGYSQQFGYGILNINNMFNFYNNFEDYTNTKILLRNGVTLENRINILNSSGGMLLKQQLPTPSLKYQISNKGDFNGDGRDDILWVEDNGNRVVWYMNKQGLISSSKILPNVPLNSGFTISGIGDFNGDGRDDILWRHSNGQVIYWMMDTNGSFSSFKILPNVPLNSGFTISGIGDFNGDGRDDILWRHSNGQVIYWMMDTNGSFSSFKILPNVPLNSGFTISGIGDFNGDGRDDILWRHSNGQVIYWMMDTNGSFSSFKILPNVPLNSGFTISGIGDFNGDGRDDILWRHSNGQVIYWMMDTNGSFSSFKILPNVNNPWVIIEGMKAV